ncbi:MAG: hypothetical protein HC785_15400 [Calothrix sp. CSU_2_0]|nr:hypothetical protein [Calothrix sp. CSU_2_0]
MTLKNGKIEGNRCKESVKSQARSHSKEKLKRDCTSKQTLFVIVTKEAMSNDKPFGYAIS